MSVIAAAASAGALPWWGTALVGLGSAVAGIAVTAAVSRSREHQKWLWEKRSDLYLRLLNQSRETEEWLTRAVRVDTWRDVSESLFKASPSRELGHEVLLFASINVNVHYNRLLTQIQRVIHIAGGKTQEEEVDERQALAEIAKDTGRTCLDLFQQMDDEVTRPPRLFRKLLPDSKAQKLHRETQAQRAQSARTNQFP